MYARPACLPWTGDIYVTDVAKADIAPESAPCASRSGHPLATEWEGWRALPHRSRGDAPLASRPSPRERQKGAPLKQLVMAGGGDIFERVSSKASSNAT
jgi:hypothetical protein